MPALHTTIDITKLKQMERGTLRNGAGEPVDRITDLGFPGFMARRRQHGIFFGLAYGRKYISIGRFGPLTLDQARAQAHKLAALISDGGDPAAEKKAKKAEAEQAGADGATVADMMREWLGHQVRQERRAAAKVQLALERHVFGKPDRPPTMDGFGAMRLAELENRSDALKIVREALDKVVDKKGKPRKAMQNLMHSYLRSASRWWVQNSDHKFRMPLPSKPYPNLEGKGRPLSIDELRDLLAALARPWPRSYRYREAPVVPALVRTLLLTGCRRNEVGKMHGNELQNGEWVIPKQRYKTGWRRGAKDHRLPLIPELKALLPRRSGFIFSTTPDGAPFSGWSKAKEILDQLIGETRGSPPRPWTWHDLRRTTSTMINDKLWRDIPNCKDLVEAVLGHVLPQIQAKYNQAELREAKADVLSKWAALLKTLEPPPDDRKVVPIKGKPKAA